MCLGEIVGKEQSSGIRGKRDMVRNLGREGGGFISLPPWFFL